MERKKELEIKINDINIILKSEEKLENYIDEVSKLECNISNLLESKILASIKEENKKETLAKERNIKINTKSNYFDILRIVACTVFAIIMWNTVLSGEVSYASTEKIKNENISIKVEEIFSKIGDIFENVSNFFMEPINLKGDK